MGHGEGLISGPACDLEIEVDADDPSQVVYTASFEELSSKYVQYNTIIWLTISIVLVLAWGVGIIMLLYLPFRRYMLQKEIGSRKLYVTSKEIVYKACRPSFIPFWGEREIEKHVPLAMVIHIIVEQGCLQSVYGLHTLRVESIAHGKAAPVDELQVQGIHNPGLLRKIVVTRASKAIQDVGRSWNPTSQSAVDENLFHTESFTLGPAILSSPSRGWKATGSLHASVGSRVVPTDYMLLKIDEVNKSVKKLESLLDKNRATTGPIQADL